MTLAASAKNFYSYKDDQGKSHIVDSIEKLPKEYQTQAREKAKAKKSGPIIELEKPKSFAEQVKDSETVKAAKKMFDDYWKDSGKNKDGKNNKKRKVSSKSGNKAGEKKDIHSKLKEVQQTIKKRNKTLDEVYRSIDE